MEGWEGRNLFLERRSQHPTMAYTSVKSSFILLIDSASISRVPVLCQAPDCYRALMSTNFVGERMHTNKLLGR